MSKRFLKEIRSGRLWGKTFLAGALTGLIVLSVAWGQTPPPAPAHPAGQVGPGSTASIGPAQGVRGAVVDAPHQVLNSALTPETRQTLQEAMNSYGSAAADNSGAAGEVILGPGEAAQLDGTTVGRIAFDTLPDRVKGALGAPVRESLNNSQGR